MATDQWLLPLLLQVNDDRVRHLQEAKDAEELANSVKREAEAKDRKHNKEVSLGGAPSYNDVWSNSELFTIE